MQAKYERQIIAIVISILFLIIPSISMAESFSQPNQQVENANMTFQDEPAQGLPSYVPVELNIRENNQLSPEFPLEGSADSSIVCPNGFTPAWWSIRKRRGSTEWRDVGTWETIRMTKQLQATGLIRFSIWMTFLGDGSPGSSNFEFNWLRNEDTIASVYVPDVDLTSGMDPIEVNAQANLINQTPFEVGDVFKLFIRCQISLDGAQILYGSRPHRSFVMMTCDPIDIMKISACEHSIKGLYSDVFRVKYNEMTYVGIVDHVPVVGFPQFGVENLNEQSYNFVSWEVKLEPGQREVEIGISYVPNNNETLVRQLQIINIPKKVEPTLFGLPVWQAQLIIFLVFLVILLLVVRYAYNRVQERRWLEMEGIEEPGQERI